MGRVKEFLEKIFGRITWGDPDIGYYPRNPMSKRKKDIEKRIEEMKEKYSEGD